MHKIQIIFLPAEHGDSFLIVFDNGTSLLLDGGTKVSMQENSSIIRETFMQCGQNIILLSHIDDDHINGICYLFENCTEIISNVSEVIFNQSEDLKNLIPNSETSPPFISLNDNKNNQTSYKNGKKFESLLKERNISLKSNLISGDTFSYGEIKFTVLSPSVKGFKEYKCWSEEREKAYTGSKKSDYSSTIKDLCTELFNEDVSKTNRSSISVLIEYKGKSMLFLADSFPTDIRNSLDQLGYTEKSKLVVDLVKVAHHGSKNNTSTEMLNMIQCRQFLISTNGKIHKHPDKECLARIISTQNCPNLIFNYDLYEEIFTEEELTNGSFQASKKNEVIL